ncbi:hypothetical protein C5C18_11020 [Rathayibacter tritici]|uniref:hypothetical protein n=1 Tax=Rathayibacter tritici TaxID=33888 RepID=UPI0008342FAF|nr:hypothetical protein [Rathayibacter tritici]PPF26231.1 hypothetical protein C5C06_11700 [Rathayibacter tritici]PPF63965.1 hypothetical protein C5C21_12430 [Rathayibacter tritici]PPG06232.1 hypothetical protein C5C18_11020 [Rathayibacter tritici]PPI17262.1 hypothetical protein C5D07_05240 [Rathayibacter tritici]PPI46112.1 hypothetical protein C5D18_05425 [Rathayibacter tritici]
MGAPPGIEQRLQVPQGTEQRIGGGLLPLRLPLPPLGELAPAPPLTLGLPGHGRHLRGESVQLVDEPVPVRDLLLEALVEHPRVGAREVDHRLLDQATPRRELRVEHRGECGQPGAQALGDLVVVPKVHCGSHLS